MLIEHVLAANMTLFCFDFPGCGKSEGDYISLGWYERDDVNVIINYLRKERKVSSIGLWGRSMGGATALFYSQRDPTIAGMVVDSSFADLSQLINEFALNLMGLPKFVANSAIKIVRASV